MMQKTIPAEVFPPGDFLMEELEVRGWTQADFAEIIGRPYRLVNEIIGGKRGVTPETAKDLADALGTTPELWMNLEAAFQLSRIPDQDDAIPRRARLYAKAPIKEMIRRNWIEQSDNIDVLEQHVRRFYSLKSLDDEPAFVLAATKSTSYESFTPAQWAWLFRARQLARGVAAADFSRGTLKSLVAMLQQLMRSAEDVQHAPKVLADFGVRLLVVEPLTGTRIDGAFFWLDSKSPVVVLSLRYDRVDSFWHTLMHEIGHLKNGEGVTNVPIDVDIVGERSRETIEKPANERQADEFAVQTLVPQDELDNFIERVQPLYSRVRIQGFANRLNIHAGIVVGQLQHRGEISYAHHRGFLVPVRNLITQASLTDGWGSVLPVAL